jgi:hypothetical protein
MADINEHIEATKRILNTRRISDEDLSSTNDFLRYVGDMQVGDHLRLEICQGEEEGFRFMQEEFARKRFQGKYLQTIDDKELVYDVRRIG